MVKVKYYRRREPNAPRTIHMVADLPEPKGKGFVQCGKYATIQLRELSRSEVKNSKDYEFCRKCSQLIGLG